MKNLTWLSPELFITSVPTEKSNDRELSSHNWVLWVKANIFVNEAFLSYPICTTIWWLVRNSLIGMWDDYRFLDKSQMLLLRCRYLAKQIGWPMNRKYNLEIGCLTTDPQAKILNLWWGVLICCGFLLVIKWTLKLRRNWSVQHRIFVSHCSQSQKKDLTCLISICQNKFQENTWDLTTSFPALLLTANKYPSVYLFLALNSLIIRPVSEFSG